MKSFLYYLSLSTLLIASCGKSTVSPVASPPSLLGLWSSDNQEEHRVIGFSPYANNQTDLFDSNGVFLDSSTIIFIDTVIETSSSLITSLVTDSFIYTTYEGSVDDTLIWYQIENKIFTSSLSDAYPHTEDPDELVIEHLDSTALITVQNDREFEDMNDTVFIEIETERTYWKRIE